MQKNTYQDAHVHFYLQIAGEISLSIEKSKLYEELSKLNDLKSKFLGIAAHDLRSPISIIKGNIDLLKEGILGNISDEQKETLTTMYNGCTRMLNLINTFLDVSTIESGKLELKKEKTNIEKFLQEVYESNLLLAKAKSINLVLKKDSNLPEIEIDKDKVYQVINNLISNALKFSEPNTTITMSSSKNDQEIQISVSDEGQCIPEEEIPKLFAFFSKTSTAPTAKEKSTGLGLAISKHIVEAHKGKIWVKNNPDKGTTFSFSAG